MFNYSLLIQSGIPKFQIDIVRTFLVAQSLRLCAPNAGSPGLIPGQGTGSHMLQLKPGAAKEINIKKQASKQKMLFPLKKNKTNSP